MSELILRNRIKELETEVSDLKSLVMVLIAENADLKREIKVLRYSLSLNSKNSSKPPSSDNFTKQTNSLREKSNKKVGGQFGHEGTTLKMVYKPDFVKIHQVLKCIYCETDLSNMEVLKLDKRQIFDIPPRLLEVTEHQAENKICCFCGSLNKGLFPDSFSSVVQYGNRIKAFCLYFNNFQFIPYERVSQTLENLTGLRVNESSIFSFTKELYDNLSLLFRGQKKSL